MSSSQHDHGQGPSIQRDLSAGVKGLEVGKGVGDGVVGAGRLALLAAICRGI